MRLPHTFFSYWFIRGYLNFTPMNIPTNEESNGVVIGGFDPAALHASTAVGDRMMATPPGILPLVSMVLSSRLCQRTMCPRTRVLPDSKVHIY